MSLPLPRVRLLLASCALAWWLGAAYAQAAPCCGLDWSFAPADAPPFSLAELEQAVRIRNPDAGGETVAVGWAYPGVVEARTRDRRRVVELGALRGQDAARLVAVAVVDVLRPPAVLEDGARADDTGGPATLTARAPAPARARALDLRLAVALNHGATSAGFAAEPTAGAALTFGQRGENRLGIALEAGYGEGRGRAFGQDFVVHMLPVRLTAVLGRGAYAAGAGALVRPYFTSGWGGGNGALWGGTLFAERRFSAWGSLGALLALGLDLPANAVDFFVGRTSLLATGRVVPWARVGVAWGAL